MKVLVIEDGAEIAAYIVRGLSQHGHAADRAVDGQDGLTMAGGGAHDVLVVDRMLPGIGNPAQGLEAGDGGHMVKPFALGELLAQLRALALRPPPSDLPAAPRVADPEPNPSWLRGRPLVDRDGRPRDGGLAEAWVPEQHDFEVAMCHAVRGIQGNGAVEGGHRLLTTPQAV